MVSFSETEKNDISDLKALWLSSFEEDEKAADLFFERIMSFAHAYKAEENGELIAAVYLVDCTINGITSAERQPAVIIAAKAL